MTPTNAPQPGFGETLQLKTLDLKQRILNGENIPIADLKAFILAAESDLLGSKPKPKIEKTAPQQDIDFF